MTTLSTPHDLALAGHPVLRCPRKEVKPLSTPQQEWKERHPVTLRFPAGIGRLLDQHADAVGLSRRALAERVLEKHTAEAARQVVQEMAERLEQPTERSTA